MNRANISKTESRINIARYATSLVIFREMTKSVLKMINSLQSQNPYILDKSDKLIFVNYLDT